MSKIAWSGEVLGVQPRIDLGRSFDERYHAYLGYVLFVRGEAAGEARELTVRIGAGAQAKHAFRAGDRVSGRAHVVEAPEREVADFYRANALAVAAGRRVRRRRDRPGAGYRRRSRHTARAAIGGSTPAPTRRAAAPASGAAAWRWRW